VRETFGAPPAIFDDNGRVGIRRELSVTSNARDAHWRVVDVATSEAADHVHA
jgi:hypothetical protein